MKNVVLFNTIIINKFTRQKAHTIGTLEPKNALQKFDRSKLIAKSYISEISNENISSRPL